MSFDFTPIIELLVAVLPILFAVNLMNALLRTFNKIQ